MAKILLVAYDLKETTDETCVVKAIQTVGDKWWHFLPTVWLVNTEKSESEAARIIYPFMTKTDRLLIIEMQGRGAGWMQPEAWEWINNIRNETEGKTLSDIIASIQQSEP